MTCNIKIILRDEDGKLEFEYKFEWLGLRTLYCTKIRTLKKESYKRSTTLTQFNAKWKIKNYCNQTTRK